MTPHRFDHIIYNFTKKKFRPYRIENVFSDPALKAYQNLCKFYYPDLIVKSSATKREKSADAIKICRFCLRKSTEVSFRNKAHLLPELMGDRNLIHDVECNECNKRFGLFENSFADFIGIYRTLDKMHGKEGIPIFKSPDKGMRMEYDKDKDSFDIKGPKGPVIDEKEGKFVFPADKHTYIPLRVMKCLYKIGYSLLSDAEISNYSPTLKLLMSEEVDAMLSGGGHFGKLYRFSFLTTYRTPTIFTYNKRPEFEEEKLPTKLVAIYFGRFMYQFILPNKTDCFMYEKGVETAWMLIPPLRHEEKVRPLGELIDLSSNQPRKGETEILDFYFEDPLEKL